MEEILLIAEIIIKINMTKNDDKISLTGYVEQFLGFLATAEVFFVLLSTVILSLSSLPI